ncbi:MAG: DnaJ domain-containing protein [Microcoleaceae cyanobacterium]
MDTINYYRKLGLKSGASLQEVKASYRRLARLYHPDVNPDNLHAKDQFIAITEAYQYLLNIAPLEAEKTPYVQSKPSPQPASYQPKTTKIRRKQPNVKFNPSLSETEQKLKERSYQQLQFLLKYKRFPRAIALVEGLAQRIPQDIEIRQWQAIAYQRWGRHLIKERQLEKARRYLKKALKTDPHNRTLWAEVERDFRRLEQIY